MGSGRKYLALTLLGSLFFALVNGLPTTSDVGDGQRRGTQPMMEKRSIVGVASHIVANSLLRHQMESNTNFVFSPLGFSSILAILREGSIGETRAELERVLEFPNSAEEIRNSYALALNHLANANPSQEPQFKTWFYIYRNNTVNPTFREIVERHYGVEVKEINRFDYDFDAPSENEYTYPTTTGFAGLEFSDEIEEETTKINGGEKTKTSSDADALDSLKEEIIKAEDEINKAVEEEDAIYKNKEASKFDRVVDDKQYVEVPVAKEEAARVMTTTDMSVQDAKTEMPSMNDETPTEMSPASDDLNNGEISNEVDPNEETIKPEAESNEYVSNPDEIDPNSEIMQAVESHMIRKRTKSAIIEDDVASALSGNSIVGKKIDSEDEMESKMLLFNGLYFRGNWAVPFQQLRDDVSDVFYNATSEKSRVTMMRSRGKFRTGFIESIDSHAVEIPYENRRYALLIVMPKTHDGIRNLIKTFNLNTLNEINSQLKEEQIHLALPRFKVETTGRAEKAMAKNGVTKLFSKEADLSGITADQELHVDELVQHVSVRVDEGAVSQNAFSATNLVRSGSLDDELTIDHPFLFFVRDIQDDIVVVAGKICHVVSNKPVTFFKKIGDKVGKPAK